jgi:hypothetical protein
MSAYSGKQALMTMRIIHFAMMAGLVLFGVVTFYLNSANSEIVTHPQRDALLLVAGAFTLMAVGLSPILFKQQLTSKLTESDDLRSKLAKYQTAHLIRSAVLEGAGLFATVISMLTRESMTLAALAIIIGVFVLSIPSAFSLERDLQLSAAEKQELL